MIAAMQPCAVCHTAGRIYGKTVIVNIDVNLAAQNQIIPIDQRIDKRLKNASFAVVRHFNAGVSGFLPAGFHIPLDKADTLIEQNDQAAGEFRTVKCIYHAAAFIKAVPACAEQAGMPDGRIICEQSACIGQLAVFVPHIERIEQLFFHAVACPRLIPLPQLGKSVILKIILGNQLVIGAVHGYARVSSKERNEQRQAIALTEFGIVEKYIYVDKQSGRDFERPQYRRLVRKLKDGDTLVVKSIDRLGRNYGEILEQWRIITKEKAAAIVVLDMPLLDTRKSRNLTGTLIADIVLQLLSYVAQTEREFIRQRQTEGIAAAKLRGVQFGRKPKEKPPEYPTVLEAWRRKELSARAAATRLGVTHKTFQKWAEQDTLR